MAIKIKKKNEGKFTAEAKAHKMGVQEFARYVKAHPEKFSGKIRKRANFARVAPTWHHTLKKKLGVK